MIRNETPNDLHSIRHVNREAFQGPAEAALVDALRESGLILASLVFERDGIVVGHALFTSLLCPNLRIASLAPVAVDPACQRQGIGAALIRTGIGRCRELGCDAMVVLGHPSYYPKFGFLPALGQRVHSPYTTHGDAWMALELRPGALASPVEVRYPDAWNVIS